MKSRPTHRISHHAARLSQFAFYPVVWAVSKVLVPTHVRGRERLSTVSGPRLLIANHIAFYDSFLLRLAVDWRTLPVRFMGVTSFRHLHLRILKYLGIIHAVYLLFGVFVVVPGRGREKNIEAARVILAQGGTVLIFPEGYINPSKGHGPLFPFKHGAAALAHASGATVIPVAFQVNDGATHISIGEPLEKAVGSDIEATTARFREAILALLREP